MDLTMHSATESADRERSQPRIAPCTRACTQSATKSGMTASVKSGVDLPARNGRCPRGFSTLQIAILNVLKAHRQIIAYWQIAELITARFGMAPTTGAVRGAMERLYRRGFLLHSRAAAGSLKGNRYAFTAEPCPYIVAYSGMESIGQADMESAAQSVRIASPSILEKKERKNTLSISSPEEERARLEALTEPDIAFHWPRLAASGFGTHQIRQIIDRLEQKNLQLSNVLPGLEHAEWALEHDLMKDKDDQSVLHPTNWVFQILAKQGYYPRPTGYVSPQEQAERDAAEEQKSLSVALEERFQAECAVWIAGLSGDKRRAILGDKNGKLRMPDDVALRNHFRAEIWSKLRNGGAQ